MRRITALFVLGLALAVPASAAAAPEAGFVHSPEAPLTGETVTFTATSDPEDAVNYWDLDGNCDFERETVVSGRVVTHSFPLPGVYRVCLAAMHDGEWDVIAKNVTVANRAPQASFAFEPAAPVAGETVTFTSSSGDSDGTIAAEAWDLNNDGSFDDATGPAASRTFEPGSHTVGLRVTDDQGAEATSFATVEVAPAPEPAPAGGEAAAPADGGVAGAARGWLTPFPTIRIAGRTSSLGARITIFSVQAPEGASVELRCAGKRCPWKKRTATIGKTKRFRAKGLQRFLRKGTLISVRVTKGDLVGKFTRFRIRALKAPVRWEACLLPGSSAPAACPAR